MELQTHVIVGGGLAGASAAATLRKEGFEGRIVLIGEEGERPYERPELSKKYLRGEPETDLFVHAAGFYAESDIEWRAGQRVERIDATRRMVRTRDSVIPFDRLLLATGASPRLLAVPGAELDGVVSLRTMKDADRIRAQAMGAGQIVVIGGGWIGSEVAASLRQLGRDVTLVLPGRQPLERVLGPDVAAVYTRAHLANGVRLVANARVDRLIGQGKVRGVHVYAGDTLPADLVVVGIGAEPRVELALAAGIHTHRGIVVDDHLQTDVPWIYAAGDVANAWHPMYRRHLRVEHWDNAKRQGRLAARNMLGGDESYRRIPYFYSDQYDLGMEYRGLASGSDEVLFRGDPADDEFIAFWLRDGRVSAAMNMNIWDVGDELNALVRSGEVVERTALIDAGRPLGALAA